MSNGDNNVTEKIKNLILIGVSTPVRVPLILPQRKRPSRIAHWKGNEEKYKGGTVVHGRKAFQGVLKYRGPPRQDIPPTNTSHFITVLPPSFISQGRDIGFLRPLIEEI